MYSKEGLSRPSAQKTLTRIKGGVLNKVGKEKKNVANAAATIENS